MSAYSAGMLPLSVVLLLALALVSTVQADQTSPSLMTLGQDAPATNAPGAAASATPANVPAANVPQAQPPDSTIVLLHEALELLQSKQIDAALDKVNAVIQADPKNVDGYGLRGGIYAAKKDWPKATKDYLSILQLDPNNVQAKFNLAEVDFLQKNYDKARPAFIALQLDPNLGDLAKYKIFLCDLFAGHSSTAASELDAFDKVGSGASYYFAEAASSLYQKKTEDARGWLTSAANIYSPAKFKLYSASLFDLGYLPLPPPPATN